MSEKRIYVVIADTVDTLEKGVVVQIPGRMAAQGGHALSRMKMHRMLPMMRLTKSDLPAIRMNRLLRARDMADEKITTIWKSCRDSRELEHVHRLLTKAHIVHYDFEDENDELYGKDYHPRTALATMPVEPERLVGITDYLPLAFSQY